jgi:hypothetical protein
VLQRTTENDRAVGDTWRIAALNELPAAAERCVVVRTGGLDGFVAALVDRSGVGNAKAVDQKKTAAVDDRAGAGARPLAGIAFDFQLSSVVDGRIVVSAAGLDEFFGHRTAEHGVVGNRRFPRLWLPIRARRTPSYWWLHRRLAPPWCRRRAA